VPNVSLPVPTPVPVPVDPEASVPVPVPVPVPPVLSLTVTESLPVALSSALLLQEPKAKAIKANKIMLFISSLLN
jgi:hypothetical protein